MKYSLVIAATILVGTAAAQNEVNMVVSPRATEVERLAGSELAGHLQLLYPSTRFAVRDQARSGIEVLLGTVASQPELARYLGSHRLDVPDSFVVATAGTKDAPMAVIIGANPRGTLFAVYALLEKLGFGFYLSYNTHPPARQGPFTFAGWSLADTPLATTRLIFNWHNFLSGCSAWDLSDWENWVTQASRMRFNTIMVHAYGNNPMFSFAHDGIRKPTGYLSTTARGRDWGTEHVLDVRTIVGGAGLFAKPVFGSSAGLVADGDTVAAATTLMRQVFRYAAARGMGVTFALDVDTETGNPQNIIATLPAPARFAVHGFQLVNPDMPEGRAYYRSQIRQLLETYPEITQIAVWFRGGRNSPWRELKSEDLPPRWRQEYDLALQSKPALRTDPDAPSMFAIGKIAKAFREILDETGHRATALAAGSWRFDYVRAADAFMPPGVALTPLDYDYAFPSDPVREAIRAVSRHRPIIPIVWAQHDDRAYAARPYIPFTGFASSLRGANTSGYGIIHWTTRPLDLYFKSLAGQVWTDSENEQLETTCSRMAEHTFGAAARQLGAEYLLAWIQDSPMFGRETTDRFIDQMVDEARVVEGCRRRLQLLDRLKPLAKPAEASNWVDYFQDLERFIMRFHQVQSAFQRSSEALRAGDIEKARREIRDVSPELVTEQYARTISHGVPSRGEKGLLISMNLRWLPYFASERQALGIEPLRIRFAPTAPELLAQSPGKNTFDFDAAHHVWTVLGTAETGAATFPVNAATPCSGGLKVDRPVALSLKLLGGEPLPAGDHEVRFDVGPGAGIDVVTETVQHIDAKKSTIILRVTEGRLDLELRPATGAAVVCGLVLNTGGQVGATP